MRLRRPRSLSGLILVGLALVALPLMVGVLWALYNLDRLAEQSARLVVTGVSVAEQNRLLAEQERRTVLERESRALAEMGDYLGDELTDLFAAGAEMDMDFDCK